MSANYAYRIITGADEMNEMGVEKWWNEICGRGKEEKTYPDSVSSTTKSTWCDRDANSGNQQWEMSA